MKASSRYQESLLNVSAARKGKQKLDDIQEFAADGMNRFFFSKNQSLFIFYSIWRIVFQIKN